MFSFLREIPERETLICGEPDTPTPPNAPLDPDLLALRLVAAAAVGRRIGRLAGGRRAVWRPPRLAGGRRGGLRGGHLGDGVFGCVGLFLFCAFLGRLGLGGLLSIDVDSTQARRGTQKKQLDGSWRTKRRTRCYFLLLPPELAFLNQNNRSRNPSLSITRRKSITNQTDPTTTNSCAHDRQHESIPTNKRNPATSTTPKLLHETAAAPIRIVCKHSPVDSEASALATIRSQVPLF